MKYLIALILFSTPCFGYDTDFSLSQPDKRAHFALSAFGGLTLGMMGTAITNDKTAGPLLGFVSMVSIGVLKEATDSHFSIGDLKADVLGSGLGALTSTIIIRF